MEAIFGVVGTLLGTVLGWLLARWNIGKLHISLGSYEEKFYRIDRMGGMEQTKTGTLTCVELNFVIHLYNSFPINRAIRECELVFLDSKGNELKRLAVDDKATRHFVAHAAHYDTIGVVNLNGYESKDINAIVFIDDLNLMYKIAKIEFHYKNEKRKEKILKYKEIDFASVPKLVKGVENNG